MSGPVDGRPSPLRAEDPERLKKLFLSRHIPMEAVLELTRRCNLKCAHCYLGGEGRGDGRGTDELSAREWRGIIDQVAAAGCLSAVFTGGEPLLRDDFAGIYLAARERGMIVTLFTNATLVDGGLIGLLKGTPPHCVEVSLYGATPLTYESVTRVPGSFERCLAGIEALAGAGLPLKLKTVLMTLNRHELPAMEELARGLGVPFRIDSSLFARLDGDRSPLAFRLTPDEAAAADLGDPERSRSWARQLREAKDLPVMDDLYTCGAGVSSFNLDPSGRMSPCVLTGEPSYDLRSGTFAEGWERVLPGLRRTKAGPDYACNRCDCRSVCGLCPSLFRLETGRAECRSDFVCATARKRYILINNNGTDKRRER